MENAMQEAATTARQRVRHPKLAMVGLLLGAFVGMFSETSLNIALPKLGQAFGLSSATLQWLVTGYMLVIGIIMPLSSLIAKWFSTRKIAAFALGAFILGSVIAALAPSFGILLAGRMIQGIGTGLVLPLMFAVAIQIFPPAKLGAVNGLMALVIMLAPAIGPTLTGILLGVASWRWLFWSFVPVLLVALAFVATSLENVGELTRPQVDGWSILESILGFSGIVGGASLASRYGWGSWQTLACLVVGLVSLAVFAKRQLKIANPILNLRILQNPGFRAGTLVVLLDFAAILSAMYLLPQYLQNGAGVAVALTGIIMLPGGVVNALTSAVAGRLADNLGARQPAMLGFAIALVGAVLLALAPATAPVALVILAHVVLMIGTPLAMAPSQTAALNSLTAKEAGDGSAILNTCQQVGGALATALATSCLEFGRQAASGSAALRFTAGAHAGFCFTIALTVVGFLVATRLPGRPRR